MKNWRVDYAFRLDGKYIEESLFIVARDVSGAIKEAESVLNVKAFQGLWDVIKDSETYCHAYVIYNVGILAEADEEVT